jgi:hypothetical protein
LERESRREYICRGAGDEISGTLNSSLARWWFYLPGTLKNETHPKVGKSRIKERKLKKKKKTKK